MPLTKTVSTNAKNNRLKIKKIQIPEGMERWGRAVQVGANTWLEQVFVESPRLTIDQSVARRLTIPD